MLENPKKWATHSFTPQNSRQITTHDNLQHGRLTYHNSETEEKKQKAEEK